MGCGELVGWFVLAMIAIAVLCGIAATVAATVGYVNWGTPFEAAGIGAMFGFVLALTQLVPRHWRRERDELERPYVAPTGAAKWAEMIVGVILFAFIVGIVTFGAHYDQTHVPGGCRGFDVDLEGKRVRAPKVPCVEVAVAGAATPWKVALLGVAREAGGTTGDLLHVCVGLTPPNGDSAGAQPALRLARGNVVGTPVAGIAPGQTSFRCGLRRHVSWPGIVIDELFLIPVAERNHQILAGEAPPAALDLGGL
jgi:hypothetical protein